MKDNKVAVLDLVQSIGLPISSDAFKWKGKTGYLTVPRGVATAVRIGVKSAVTGRWIQTDPNEESRKRHFNYSDNNKPYTLTYKHKDITFMVTYE